MDNAFVIALKLPAGFLEGVLFRYSSLLYLCARIVFLCPNRAQMPERKDYRVADAAKKNPENETEEIVVRTSRRWMTWMTTTWTTRNLRERDERHCFRQPD